jgi:signal transduction histidine kinase
VEEGLAFERDLARSIAWVRVVLCAMNFLVILLDSTMPDPSTPAAFANAMAVSTAFFAYAFVAVALVSLYRGPMRAYFVVTPLLDLAFTSALMLVTEGYLSPFDLWLVFCVVASGFSQFRWMPLVTALCGIAAQALIAMIPQRLPLEAGVFAVRTAYLFGFASILAAVSAFVVSQSRYWRLLEHAGARFAQSADYQGVVRTLFESVAEVARVVRAQFEMPGAPTVESRPHEEAEHHHPNGPVYDFQVPVVGETSAHIHFEFAGPINRVDHACIRALCDRAASSLARVEAANRIVDLAIKEERLSMADELHDGYIQTLSAVDMRLETVRRKVPTNLAQELENIKSIVRDAAKSARSLITPIVEEEPPGPNRVVQAIKERWRGPLDLPDYGAVPFTQEQWKVVELAAKEAANNARKHGNARNLALGVEQTDSTVVVTFTDDGTGPGESPTFGYGLRRLKSAVEGHGGTVALAMAPEGGTVLRVELPK